MIVAGDVLDADDPLVDLEFDDPIDEQERIAMQQDAFDGGVIEGQGQVHEDKRLYWHEPARESADHPASTGCPRQRARGADGALRARPRGDVGPRSGGAAPEDS